jgi:uncharacterized protein YjbI with pentapeptide repeats
VSDDKAREGGEVASAGRGWNIVNLASLKTPPEAFVAFVYSASSVILITLIAFGLISSFRFAYETFIGDLKDRVEAAKVFFPVLVALIGGPILIWRAVTAHWAAQAARHQAETGREAHFTTLFTKAVEQLGATRDVIKTSAMLSSVVVGEQQTHTETEPNLEVRLGAIYALERVARDSERDHQSITDVLCAYVRNRQNCGTPVARPDDAYLSEDMFGSPSSKRYQQWIDSIPRPRVDIQAAVTVLARRQTAGGGALDFGNANLQCAEFHGGKFGQAIFVGAYIDRASFRGADLTGSLFMGAHLERADMVKACLDGVWFASAALTGARLDQARGENVLFDRARLGDAAFNEAQLFASSFFAATLDRTQFNGAILRDAHFEKAEASGASFFGAGLHNVSFSDTKLYGVNFMNAKFDGGSFHNARLDATAFFDSDLTTVGGLSTEQLSTALGDASTILPSGIQRPPEWAAGVLGSDERTKLIHVVSQRVKFRT